MWKQVLKCNFSLYGHLLNTNQKGSNDKRDSHLYCNSIIEFSVRPNKFVSVVSLVYFKIDKHLWGPDSIKIIHPQGLAGPSDELFWRNHSPLVFIHYVKSLMLILALLPILSNL